MGVAATKRILRETSGSKVNLAFEAVNCCNNNTPQSHVRLKEDVGDPRVKVCLDPTNMMQPGVFFRSTELLNLCFDLLGEDIVLCHAKDSTWNSMSTAINEGATLGEGNMDYAQYLARLSHMKYSRALLIEHLPRDAYPPSKQHLVETAAKIGVKIYS
jgi:sugar phosphate isomerase/epimerase